MATYKVIKGSVGFHDEGETLSEDEVKGWDLPWLLKRGVLAKSGSAVAKAAEQEQADALGVDADVLAEKVELAAPDSPLLTTGQVGGAPLPADKDSPLLDSPKEQVSPTGDSEPKRGPGRPSGSR